MNIGCWCSVSWYELDLTFYLAVVILNFKILSRLFCLWEQQYWMLFPVKVHAKLGEDSISSRNFVCEALTSIICEKNKIYNGSFVALNI